MKLDINTIKKKLFSYIPVAKKYAVLIFVLTALCVLGYLVFNIRILANKEPSESAIDEKVNENKPVNIDESAVKQIEKLQSANVEVKSLFEQSRDNPFQE